MATKAIDPDMIGAHRARRELRDKLLERLESERQKLGLKASTFAGRIGMCDSSYKRMLGNTSVTIDSCMLYLHRLGIDVEVTIRERGEQ